VLDRLPHHRGESRRADRVRTDPRTACWGAAFELRGVDGEPQREMGEDLFDFAGQSAPVRDDRSGALNHFARAFRGPERPRQLERRSEKAMRGAAAREEGAVGAAGEEHNALPSWSRLRLGAAGVNLRDAGLERRAVFR
jgi:hypothetical protein